MALLPVILVCAGVLGAETYFVSPSGSDGNAGTTQTASFATINKAAETATAGDTDVLTVDRSISWDAGEPYTGAGPDIGAFPADRSTGIRSVAEVRVDMKGIRGRLFDLSGRAAHPGIVHGPGVFLYRVPDTGEMRKVLSRP